LPSAARWNTSSVSRKQRLTTATEELLLRAEEPEDVRLRDAGLAAIASVLAPCRPCSANSTSAASSTASRRSSADFRFGVTAIGK
jgi:hypothetical protein